MGRIGKGKTFEMEERTSEILSKKRSDAPSVAVAAFQEKKEEV